MKTEGVSFKRLKTGHLSNSLELPNAAGLNHFDLDDELVKSYEPRPKMPRIKTRLKRTRKCPKPKKRQTPRCSHYNLSVEVSRKLFNKL